MQSSLNPATPSAWTQMHGSRHRDDLEKCTGDITVTAWNLECSSTEREYSETSQCQEKNHFTRHPHLHFYQVRAAWGWGCFCPCANVWRLAKAQELFALCAFLNTAQAWFCPVHCVFSPQRLPLKLKSSVLLRHGLILNRYTENSSLQWFRNQTGRSVFTGALTEQLGKEQCQICICFLSPAPVFFLCQECKVSHWLCSWCQCVCGEGQGREKAEKRRRTRRGLHN